MTTLLTLLDRRIAPDQIVVDDVQRRWTWGQLRASVEDLARRLTALQLERVALHADNCADWLIVDLACQRAGIPCIPIPGFFSGGQLAHVLAATAVDAIFTAEPSQFDPVAATLVDLPGPNLRLLLREVAPSRPALPQGTGKVTFTSGSTGQPKGVCLSTAQQLLQAKALAAATGLQAPRHLCVLPLAVLLENIAGVYAPLLAGGCIVLRPLATLGFAGSTLQEPALFLQQLNALQPHTLILIPQLLQLLVQAATRGWRAPALRFIAVGGARVAPDLLATARSLGLAVYEGYGLSECGSVVSLNAPGAELAGSCGRVLPHFSVRAQDGELRVRGNLMLGYLNEPGSWYPQEFATGDLGLVDAEGFVQVQGRRKNLLISSYGRNIAPEWIESELLATLLFRDAVLVGDSRPWCSALLYPVQHQLSDQHIQQAIDAINARLPDYARVRRWWRLPQPLAALPGLLTANGRPRREAINAAFHEQIDALYRGAAHAAPNLQPETIA